MSRIALGLAYDGARYHGWQVQPGLRTVQSVVESALSRIAGHPVSVICAGRTDAGVHATAQVLHFDTAAERPDRAWVQGTNSYLPRDVSVLWAKPVSDQFHARFSATARRYRYVIYNERIRPAILEPAVTTYYRPLAVQRMQEGATYLLGTHDFASFQGSGCQAAHPIRTIHQITVTRVASLVIIDIRANAFLLHMVRNIAGVLTAVGCGDRAAEWVLEVLSAQDRRQAAVTLPPNGLYLVVVDYPEPFGLPVVPVGPYFLRSYQI